MSHDPRYTQATRELVSAAIASAGHCDHPGAESCTPWWHADAALTALADAGLLVAPDGVAEVEKSWSHRDGTDCINEDCYDRRPVQRTVTTWPNGNELVTPWVPVNATAEVQP